MKRLLSASKDTYITNRIIRNAFRATDTNVGQAGTLDLFKLAGESSYTTDGPLISGTTDPIELTRLLLKFDLSPLYALTSSILDISDQSFKCTLKMFDVIGGQTIPSNFTAILYPLSKSFDEGLGRDVISYEDIDSCNFITASTAGGSTSIWAQSGANAMGYAGQQNVDVITGSTSLGNMFATQYFAEGSEDLSMDITSIISATMTNQLPDHGFRISFSGSQETDSKTRFVKRFISRHSTNTRQTPRVIIGWDDSVHDNHENFEFDVSGSLFLNNFARGQPSNIVSGTAATQISGLNSLLLTVTSGTNSGSLANSYFSLTTTASQHQVGTNFIPGVYSASLSISSFEPALRDEIINAQSATFTEIWGSLDGTIGYHTGTLVVKTIPKSSFSNVPERLKLNVTNMREFFKVTEKVRFRVFAQDEGTFSLRYTRVPIEAKSVIFDKAYYRVRDTNSNETIFEFDETTNSTKLSTDSSGMYFDLFMNDLDVGRVYQIDMLINNGGVKQIFERVGGVFRVDP